MDWIIANKQWLFSGLLVAVPRAIIGWFFSKRRSTLTQRQRGGKGSTNIQVGGDLDVGKRSRDE